MKPMRKKNWAVNMADGIEWMVTLTPVGGGQMISYYYSSHLDAEEVFVELTKALAAEDIATFDHAQGRTSIDAAKFSGVIISPVTAATEQMALQALQQHEAQALAEQWWAAKNDANTRLRAEAEGKERQRQAPDPTVMPDRGSDADT